MPIASVNFEPLQLLMGRDRFRADGLTRQLFQVDGVRPSAIVEPEDPRELTEVVRWARGHQAALVPVTSGAYLALGAPPETVDVVVSLARMNRVLHYDPGDLTFGAEPGVLLRHAQESLGVHRLFLPADPPYSDRAALGGLIAANAAGPLRFGYGTWRDFVVGMSFVTGDGKLVKTGGRVVKNVAGYDLSKLLIGSLGTLGIIAEINFKVYPLPAATAAIAAGFRDLRAALALRDRIVHSAWQPLAVELMSPEAARLSRSRQLSSEHWSLVVRVGGSESVLRRYESDLDALAQELQASSFTWVKEQDERELAASVRELLPTVRAANPQASVVKAALPLTSVGPFLERALPVAERYELAAAATAHAGSGIVFVYLLPPPEMVDFAHRVAQAATEMIHAGNNLSGRVTVPWCPTAVKRDVSVWGPLRDDFTLMKKLKAQFDPDRILNPGRFVGGL